MKFPSLKDCVKGEVSLEIINSDGLNYRCDNGFTFAVPFTDVKGGIFLPKDKALLYMRWIRKSLEMKIKAYSEMTDVTTD